jgi:hypothetical protein
MTVASESPIVKAAWLRTDAPPLIEKDGHCNCVLARHSDNFYCPTNTYLPRWDVCSVPWYLNNRENYDGWIEIEGEPDVPMPPAWKLYLASLDSNAVLERQVAELQAENDRLRASSGAAAERVSDDFDDLHKM